MNSVFLAYGKHTMRLDGWGAIESSIELIGIAESQPGAQVLIDQAESRTLPGYQSKYHIEEVILNNFIGVVLDKAKLT